MFDVFITTLNNARQTTTTANCYLSNQLDGTTDSLDLLLSSA